LSAHPTAHRYLDLQQRWDRASDWYDTATGVLEVLVFRRLRAWLLRVAVGRVLDVAAGTGSNLGYYPAGTDLVAVDLSAQMLAKARQRGMGGIAVMDGERLSFRDDSFDTVVFTLLRNTLMVWAALGRVEIRVPWPEL